MARRLKQIKPVNNVCDSQFENNMQKGAEKSVKNSMDTSQAHHSSEGENHPQNMDVSQANHSSEGKTRPSNQALPRETCGNETFHSILNVTLLLIAHIFFFINHYKNFLLFFV